MDVQCDRCKTEYEFDDALVSGRGTTVRCTHCGHQFKVRLADGAAPPEDRWVVRTGEGEQITFSTLRDLQQAILSKQIRRADALVRGGAAPRPLGSITELDPFFEGRTSSRPPPADPGARDGATPAAFPKAITPWSRDGSSAGSGPAPAPGVPARTTELYRPPSTLPPAMSGPRNVETLRPAADGIAAAPPAPSWRAPSAAPQSGPPPPSSGEAPWAPTPAPNAAIGPPPPGSGEAPWAPTPAPNAAIGPPPWAAAPGSSAIPPPGPSKLPSGAPLRRSTFPFDDDLAGLRQSPPSSGEDPYFAPRRRTVGGWIVAVVLLLAVGVVGWAVAKPYLTARDSEAPSQIDPRAQALVAEGEKAMSEGRLDAAQRDFDKASVLSEKDPRVLLDEALVAAREADLPWLKLRLLPPDSLDEIRTTKAQLDETIARVHRSSDDALAAAPDDVSALRAKIDALRLEGDRDAARRYVAKVIGQASQPETAYVLAALDLAEAAPLWTTIVDRLRLAAGADGDAGRAEAALIYALAKSGDAAAAKVELSKFEAAPRPYPLLPFLRAFAERSAPTTATLPSSGSRPEPSPKIAAARGAPMPPPPAADAIDPSDPRLAMQSAAQALKKAEFARARQIYQSVVDRNPNDSEAIAGLGDVARLQGDAKGAAEAYRRAIAVNPSYLPALLGLADTEWAGGDRVSAAKTYGDIADRFPEGTYPAYVSQRTAEASSSGVAPVPSAASSQPPGPSSERTE